NVDGVFDVRQRFAVEHESAFEAGQDKSGAIPDGCAGRRTHARNNTADKGADNESDRDWSTGKQSRKHRSVLADDDIDANADTVIGELPDDPSIDDGKFRNAEIGIRGRREDFA